MVSAVTADASQLNTLALSSTGNTANVSQLAAMALGNFPSANGIVGQLTVMSVVKPAPNAQISQLQVLVLCRGSADQHRIRAWTFTQDGHRFYVLRLGEDSTYVYDTATQRWALWRTMDFDYWVAQSGMNWENEIVAGDAHDGIIYDVAADQDMDDKTVEIERICTGGFPMRMRNALGCNGVVLTGSVGNNAGNVSITLETSDDNGKNWLSHGTLNITVNDKFPELCWQSLGTIHAPGRLFKITDTGVATRIDGLDMW